MTADMTEDEIMNALLQSGRFDETPFTSPALRDIGDLSVNPADLQMDRIPSSIPNSARWTGLSESYLDSPSDSFETSPLFPTDNLDNVEFWPSLFPDDQGFEGAPALQNTVSSEGVLYNPMEIENSKEQSMFPPLPGNAPRYSDGEEQQSESPSSSPQMQRTKSRHSSSSGVAPRKRSTPLPPIVVADQSDTIAIKRARNTLAARKSRARRVEKFEELEKRIEDLEDEVTHWKNLALSKGA